MTVLIADYGLWITDYGLRIMIQAFRIWGLGVGVEVGGCETRLGPKTFSSCVTVPGGKNLGVGVGVWGVGFKVWGVGIGFEGRGLRVEGAPRSQAWSQRAPSALLPHAAAAPDPGFTFRYLPSPFWTR